MKVLGLSCFYHDAAAALVVDGSLVAAAGEERFTRIKHDPELPRNAVGFCLDRADSTINDIDHVVFYDKPLLKLDRIVTGYLATPLRSYRAFAAALPLWLRRKLWVDHVIHRELGYNGQVLYVPHHLSHAAGAFFGSPFEQAATLTVDGVGEWATASYGVGDGPTLRLLAEMRYPHSVGLLYSAFTHYLGFRVNSAEYKVMGLAPYGRPCYAELIENKLVRIHDDGSIHLNLNYFTFHRSLTMTGTEFESLFGRPRREPESEIENFHEDVAASIQAVTEKIVLKMARHVRRETGLTRLCLSGGVALNCKANGLLLRERIFDEVYIQPAAGDAGGAVGAALYAYHTLTCARRRPQPFFGIGPRYSADEIREFLELHGIPYTEDPRERQLAFLAGEIATGHIVAIFQGTMEFGPRALGFRSIVADPRDVRMKEKINRAVKYREPFRPFAPAVMLEHAAEYFDCTGASPYMLVNFAVATDKRSVIPAVTHIDNSARVQTVTRRDNPLFYDLLAEFNKVTGIPVLLNTSFNLRGHPIVESPKEAFATFCSGGIDYLVLEHYVIDKGKIGDDLRRRFAV
jgi:carbamoyltransferase